MENSLQDITQLIRIKEKELHDVHDQRCRQLEQLVAERDNLLIESSKRFEQLRDDFQYNLALLEARDTEIERLESHVKQVSDELNESNAERRALRGRIDILEIKEAERFEKHEESKAANKRILQELKDVIESMRWAAAEETRVKEREIESLKEDIQRIHHSRDESLEAQRKDLTHTFETLLQQREDAFSQREKEIAIQIVALEGKFQILQTENSRLKSENGDMHRRVESLTDEVSTKDEYGRQLQWRLDDERTSRQQSDDQMQRRVHQMTLDLSITREKAIQDVGEVQRALDKATNELDREKEFRAAAEKRLKEQQSSTQQEWGSLSHEIADARKAEASVRKENQALTIERDSYVEARAVARAEADAAELRCRSCIAEIEALRVEVESAKNRLIASELQLAKTETELAETKRAAVETALAAERRASEWVADVDQARAADALRMRESAMAEASGRVQAMVGEYESRLTEMEVRCVEAYAERDDARAQVERCMSAVDEERVESNALRLRLQLMDGQMGDLQHRLVATGEGRGMRREGFSVELEAGYEATLPTRDGPTAGRDHLTGGPPSPAFSEDFGPASLPDSPLHPTPPAHQHRNSFNYRQQYTDRAAPLPASALSSTDGSAFRTDQEGREGREGDFLAEENERLKAIIRDMRADVETMQTEMVAADGRLGYVDHRQGHRRDGGEYPDGGRRDHRSDSQSEQEQEQELGQADHGRGSRSRSASVDRHDGRHDDRHEERHEGRHKEERFEQLESRLTQTTREVSRLRTERKRLMEVGNELRAALNRQGPVGGSGGGGGGSGGSGNGSAGSAASSSSSYGDAPPRPPHGNTSGVTTVGTTGTRTGSGSGTGSGAEGRTGAGVGRDVPITRPPLNYPPALRATSHLGGTHHRHSPPRQRHPQPQQPSLPLSHQPHQPYLPHHPPQAPSTRPVEAIGAAIPSIGSVHPSSASVPVALTNSDRTTLSQLKARQRMVDRQAGGREQGVQRRVYNYARGGGGAGGGGEDGHDGHDGHDYDDYDARQPNGGREG